MSLSWCGATAERTSVKAYRVDQSTNGGSSYQALLKSTKRTSTTRNLAAVDALPLARPDDRQEEPRGRLPRLAGRRASPRSEDSSSAITYTGAWQTHSTSSVSGGTERYTSHGRRLGDDDGRIDVRAFAIVGPRSSTRGSFQVYVDGVAVATVSEKRQRLARSTSGSCTRASLTPGTTHTIRIVVRAATAAWTSTRS